MKNTYVLNISIWSRLAIYNFIKFSVRLSFWPSCWKFTICDQLEDGELWNVPRENLFGVVQRFRSPRVNWINIDAIVVVVFGVRDSSKVFGRAIAFAVVCPVWNVIIDQNYEKVPPALLFLHRKLASHLLLITLYIPASSSGKTYLT